MQERLADIWKDNILEDNKSKKTEIHISRRFFSKIKKKVWRR